MLGSPQQETETDEQSLTWRFGDFYFDEATRTLSNGGQILSLERKPLEVLAYLLNHAGEVVSKAELAETIWTRKLADDAVIVKAVGKLRSALNDNKQSLIKTVHGIGYRLVCEVEYQFQDSPAPKRRLNLNPGQAVPHRDNWRLLEPLGSGSFGAVWLVEHQHTYERRVFKFAVESKGLAALKREVALSRILHENLGNRDDITRLLDWNLGEAPYFVERAYCPLGNLPHWAESLGGLLELPIQQRIEILRKTAMAVAAAHSIGVLHKDLKPDNILIANEGEKNLLIRIADFGSGGLLDPAALRTYSATASINQSLESDYLDGTTAMYLAPELIAGQAPTLKSDVYALGVMLYQMMIGDFTRPLSSGWQRDIDDSLLKEDIAACVEGHPEHRLADAESLAQRLDQLEKRRIQIEIREQEASRRQQLELRVGTFRRRRFAVAVFVATMAIGLGATSVFYAKARDAAAQAERQRQIAESINEFLIDDLIATANPERPQGRQLSVRQLVDIAAAKAQQRFENQPQLEAPLRTSLASVYHGLGAPETAEHQLELARKVLLDSNEANSNQAARIEINLAKITAKLDRSHESIERMRSLLDTSSMLLSTTDGKNLYLEALQTLADSLINRGDLDQAIKRLDQAEAYMESNPKLEIDASIHFTQRAVYGKALLFQGDMAGAAEKLSAAYQLRKQHLGENDAATLSVAVDHGSALLYLGEYVRAEQVLARAKQALYTGLGENYYHSLRAASFHGRALMNLDEDEKALEIFQKLLPRIIEHLGSDHLFAQVTRFSLATVAYRQKNYAQAVEQYRSVENSMQDKLGADVYASHPHRFSIGEKLTMSLTGNGQWTEAIDYGTSLIQDGRKSLPPHHQDLLNTSIWLTNALLHEQQWQAALSLIGESLYAIESAPEAIQSSFKERFENLQTKAHKIAP